MCNRDFLKIKSEFPVEVKVATGGTLARKHKRIQDQI